MQGRHLRRRILNLWNFEVGSAGDQVPMPPFMILTIPSKHDLATEGNLGDGILNRVASPLRTYSFAQPA